MFISYRIRHNVFSWVGRGRKRARRLIGHYRSLQGVEVFHVGFGAEVQNGHLSCTIVQNGLSFEWLTFSLGAWAWRSYLSPGKGGSGPLDRLWICLLHHRLTCSECFIVLCASVAAAASDARILDYWSVGRRVDNSSFYCTASFHNYATEGSQVNAVSCHRCVSPTAIYCRRFMNERRDSKPPPSSPAAAVVRPTHSSSDVYA